MGASMLSLLLLVIPLLSLTAGAASMPPGTTTADSLFQPCPFPAFDSALRRLSKVLTFQTISSAHTDSHALQPQEFAALWEWVAAEYTEVFEQLQVEQVGAGGLSRLVTWHGSDPSLLPVLFVSHVDVVPVTEETVKDWTHPPFSGAVADGYVWGRGAMDIKGAAIALLEAATVLLREGFRPRRTLLIALGHDEEVGGAKGAGQIAALLAARGVQLAMVWDEGSPIIVGGLLPHINTPVALVATAEKTYQSVKVTLHSPGGHSSMPATDGSSMAARLGRLLLRIATVHPPLKLVPPTSHFIQGLARIAPVWLQPLLLAVEHLAPLRWLFVRLMAAAGGDVAAMVRATAAVTHVQAGVAGNVMPQAGTITINFRTLPGETSNSIQQQLLHWLGDDAQHANITFTEKWETPAAVTDPEGPHFALISAAIREVWQLKGHSSTAQYMTGVTEDQPHATAAAAAGGDGTKDGEQQQQQLTQNPVPDPPPSSAAGLLPVIPYLLCGGTDSKWYANLTSNILRFAPFSINRKAGELKRVHGTDERLSVGDFGRMLCTYKAGMRMAGMHMHLGSEPTAAAVAAVDAAAAAEDAAAAQEVSAGPDGSAQASHAVSADAGSLAGTVRAGSSSADEL